MVHRIVYLCITIRNGYDIWAKLFETLFIFGIDQLFTKWTIMTADRFAN